MSLTEKLTNTKGESSESPFIDIPNTLRWLFITYFLLKTIVLPLMKTYVNGDLYPNTYTRLAVDIFTNLLIIAPFIFYKKNKYGFLHPLFFPAFLSMAKSAMKNIDSLFLNLFDATPQYNFIVNAVLKTESQMELSNYHLEEKFYLLIYTAIYYATFYLVNAEAKFKVYERKFDLELMKKRLILVVLAVFGVALIFFQMRGGITSHFSSFGMGRQNALKGLGIVFVILNLSTLLISTLVAFDKGFFKTKIFIVLLLLSLVINYLAYGSRTAIFTAVQNIMIIWLIHNKKIPYSMILVLGFVGFLAVGLLGKLRDSTYKGEVNWELLTEISISENAEALKEEVIRRDVIKAPDIVVISKGVEDYGLLYGKSYGSALFFFVPRFLWESKPHSIGYYTGTILFDSVGGIPPSIHMEAYWNFYIYGVVFIAFIHGYMHKWMVDFYLKNKDKKSTYVLYAIMLIWFNPYSLYLVHYLQELFSILIIYYLLGIIKFKKGKVNE